MTRAIIFPGQGSQFIGMGKELYDTFLEAKEVFQEVDDTLHQKLSSLMFYGDLNELTQTINAQPSIMAVSMACTRVIEKQSNKKLITLCKYMAGHSLGEYTAYATVQSLELSTVSDLLRTRGKAMLEADPNGVGGMVAIIGADIEQAMQLCAMVQDIGLCQIANDNGAGQIVLSGIKAALDKAMEISAQFGVRKCVKLNVSSAFHSQLMYPAKEIMQIALNNTVINKAQIEVIANVSVQAVTEPEKIKESLAQQVVSRVRWRETMMYIANAGITEVVEIGPGKVLASIAKKMYPELKITSISTPYDIEIFLGDI